jgi:hypothetical protein
MLGPVELPPNPVVMFAVVENDALANDPSTLLPMLLAL